MLQFESEKWLLLVAFSTSKCSCCKYRSEQVKQWQVVRSHSYEVFRRRKSHFGTACCVVKVVRSCGRRKNLCWYFLWLDLGEVLFILRTGEVRALGPKWSGLTCCFMWEVQVSDLLTFHLFSVVNKNNFQLWRPIYFILQRLCWHQVKLRQDAVVLALKSFRRRFTQFFHSIYVTRLRWKCNSGYSGSDSVVQEYVLVAGWLYLTRRKNNRTGNAWSHDISCISIIRFREEFERSCVERSLCL